jgi:hypothetical protein
MSERIRVASESDTGLSPATPTRLPLESLSRLRLCPSLAEFNEERASDAAKFEKPRMLTEGMTLM